MTNRFFKGPVTEPLEGRLLLAGQLVINEGGSYSGEFESLDRRFAAIVVNTDEPVVIENSTLRGRGPLIISTVDHTNITVRNCEGYALNPNLSGRSPGRFLAVEDFDNIVLENNYMEGTRGIHLLNYLGDHSINETVRVVGNRARNIDGRKSNGANGWLDYNVKINKVTGVVDYGFSYAQFLQLDKVSKVPGIEIAWNEVINEPGKSRVEDNINVYLSSGTPSSPIRIHDNYIQGAYTIKPTQRSYTSGDIRYDWGFSGGGILLGDGEGRAAAEDTAFVKAYDNQVVSTTNYGIAIAAGHDMEIRNNRVISSSLLQDGRKIAYANVGIYVWDSYHVGTTRFYRNSAHDNFVGWVYPFGRNDTWTLDESTIFRNTSLTAAPTLDTEFAEFNRWDAKSSGDRNATINGTVWRDIDGDGVRDAGEPGKLGVQLFIDLNNDKRLNSGEPTDTTDASGRWEFEVSAGEPIVRMTVPMSWVATRGNGVAFIVSAAKTYARDFGLKGANTTSGLVFNDANANGKRDAGEAGLSAWRVFADKNANGKLDTGEVSVLTDAAGAYTFRDLPEGAYRITIVQQATHQRIAPTRGWYAVTLAPGVRITAGSFAQKRIV